jgi:2-pyrone-4,6-dicarboxylate lactonase
MRSLELIVQSTAYGTDSRILEASLRKAGPNYRGVAIIDDTITDADCERMTAAGVIGARFAFVRTLQSAPSLDTFLKLADRCHAHGWLIKVHATGVDLLEIREALEKIRGPAVLDHISNFYRDGIDHPGADYARRLLRQENWWFMLSNGDRHSEEPFPHPTAIAFARSFIEAAPDRMIWGSDWPHPLIPLDKEMKNDAVSL